ncbi:accessory gene regulator B family protein (plasmid) [Bacillus sp. F19]|nr:accessory gene regulator B family protein [Bacillus sp. F19]
MQNLLPNRISVNLANLIIVHNPELIDKKDEIRYGLEWIISGLNQVILTVMVALPFGLVLEALFTLLSGAFLRMFSGGAHARGYFKCLLISMFQVLIISFIAASYSSLLEQHIFVLCFMLVFSFGLVYIKAPVLMKKKELFNSNDKLKLRYLSLLTFVICLLISFLPEISEFKYCIWLSLIIQSLSLTNTLEKALTYLRL